MEDNPRFRDAAIGIIVSSSRALKIFLRSASRVNRLPDYIVVEGPLAGGHLGFGVDDWQQFSLKDIVEDVLRFLKENDLSIPVIPAGGVFTGTDAVEFIEMGASAVQVATRFTITKECGLPAPIKQEYLRSQEQDVEVNMISPTGYAMRMLKSSPALRSNIKPNCESLGYILDKNGKCGYHEAYKATGVDEKGRKLPVTTKMCICYHFMNFQCYTCGHYVYRLKNTTYKLPDGSYYLPPAEHIINDYLNSVDHKVALPVQEAAQKVGRLVVLEAY
jgi:NAD(P)H-dependent flavin oxidoreductase YrpB (nitropropane dioxygenase family)